MTLYLLLPTACNLSYIEVYACRNAKVSFGNLSIPFILRNSYTKKIKYADKDKAAMHYKPHTTQYY